MSVYHLFLRTEIVVGVLIALLLVLSFIVSSARKFAIMGGIIVFLSMIIIPQSFVPSNGFVSSDGYFLIANSNIVTASGSVTTYYVFTDYVSLGENNFVKTQTIDFNAITVNGQVIPLTKSYGFFFVYTAITYNNSLSTFSVSGRAFTWREDVPTRWGLEDALIMGFMVVYYLIVLIEFYTKRSENSAVG